LNYDSDYTGWPQKSNLSKFVTSVDNVLFFLYYCFTELCAKVS